MERLELQGPAPSPGRRELKKQVTRRELLLAGRRLFSDRGLYESRIEDVAERAGVAKGTLYLYFRDKDDLILAVVNDSFSELRAGIDLADCARSGLRPVVSCLVEGHLRFLARHPDRLRILHQARGLLLFRMGRWSGLLGAFEGHLDWIAERLGEAGEEGRAQPRAQRLGMARMLFGSVSGIVSVHEATGSSLRTLLRRPTPASALTALVLRSAWIEATPRSSSPRGRHLPLRR